MSIARPDGSDEIASVGSLTEIVVFHAFFVYVIPVLDLDTCVDNRDQTDMIVLHLLNKAREIIKLTAYGEVFIRVHIVDVHIDHIKRDV